MGNSEGSRLYNNRWMTEAHPYPNTDAYGAGDLVGTKMEFADAIQADYGAGEIVSVVVVDKDKQSKALDLLIFTEDLAANTGAGTTWATGNNAALRVADSDAMNCIGKISVSTGNYSVLSDNSIAVTTTGLPFYIKGSRSLYGLVVSRGTPTYSTDGLLIRLGIERDN